MSISYNRLNKLLNSRGLSPNKLAELGVINDGAGRKIRSGGHISTKHLESICRYLDVNIGDIIEFSNSEPTER